MKASYDLIVVGGGPSGLIAAGRAGERGLRVLLLEKNKRLGEKLRITGNGRCNITNAEEDERVLLKKYGKGEQFLYSLFSQFGVKQTFSFFEKNNLPLVVEEFKRAFPKSQKAEDVERVLEAYVKKNDVEIRTSSPVNQVFAENGRITAVQCEGERYSAKEYIFATGGTSHPETGSTGEGFKWLEQLGHSVIKPTPSVVPLAVKEQWAKSLSGTSLSSMKITFYLDAKKEFNLSGKILFTHFGISGPLILNSAHRVADLLHGGTVTATIDAYPKTDLGTLEKEIIGIFDANKNKTLKNIIKELSPQGIHKGIALLFEEQFDTSIKVHSITKEDRKHIVHILKALPLTILGLMGLDRAVVSDGGIPLTEIDMRTMRSQKITNLFLTGDLLNVNRPSGGYSLQLCWSTGYVAGSNAAKSSTRA